MNNSSKDEALNEYLSKRREKDKKDGLFHSICQIVAANFVFIFLIVGLFYADEFDFGFFIMTVFIGLFALMYDWAFYETYIKKTDTNTQNSKTKSCRLCKKILPLNSYGICESCNDRISKKLEEKKARGEIIECKICGMEIEYNEQGYCKKCQDKILKEIDKKEKIYCTNCGKEVDGIWKHCKYCGTEIK